MHQQQAPSALLREYLNELTLACHQSGADRLPVLDLACGFGRNGLYLVSQDLPVLFADLNTYALAQIEQQAAALNAQGLASYWHQDFELPGSTPLKGKVFSAVLVFRYLHRPLMAAIKQAVKPGGVIIYETFTRAQAEFGRPKNPDFLLEPGELAACFSHWHMRHHFEGIVESNGVKQAIARIVAVKPDE
ncbi:class I SAM-dependent methyltransferase [Thalassomonas haliotis]|uniref:Class I SAM-dependent methyltransferase n=1 Tax=Thalassomonas haliotis TaxID=485448 RepID=A0ABY7VIX5_9GAMM|nr:class I SAM-dependent methyltransferase [Thalassomonas haliotis]WDE13416.1 class I SAM-dependent methyltransferase [Thalassomonas haliotis]